MTPTRSTLSVVFYANDKQIHKSRRRKGEASDEHQSRTRKWWVRADLIVLEEDFGQGTITTRYLAWARR